MRDLKNKTILLVVTGGIAAYKSLELIRLIKKAGGRVRTILTEGGARFVTPLSVSALCEEDVYTDLWSLKDETEMGHIRLSREANLILVAPASADFIAKMAGGHADDLASTVLLAADKPILMAPAMNHKMWEHPATQENIATLKSRGVKVIGPHEGDMACGEYGMGRMSEPEEILDALVNTFSSPLTAPSHSNEAPSLGKRAHGMLSGKTAIVTAGPTIEPVDPVRFIGNRSSGRQGHAIAKALAEAGAKVTLISGPVDKAVSSPLLNCVNYVAVETATEMLAACEAALPADVAVCAAAVSDWSPAPQDRKIKKTAKSKTKTIKLNENPDILKTLSNHKKRPALVVGFAAETENLLENMQTKLKIKGCDWILGNEITSNQNVFGSEQNHIHFVDNQKHEDWGRHRKEDVAKKLVRKIGARLNQTDDRAYTDAAE